LNLEAFGITDEYMPHLDLMKFVRDESRVSSLEAKHGLSRGTIGAFRYLHEHLHKLLSATASTYWLYWLQIKARSAFRDVLHLVENKSLEKTMSQLIDAKDRISICEYVTGCLSEELKTLQEPFIAVSLSKFAEDGELKAIGNEVGKRYVNEIASRHGPKIVDIYKKMSWIAQKKGMDFLLELMMCSLNLPIGELNIMNLPEIFQMWKQQSLRLRPVGRFWKLMRLMDERQDIKNLGDMISRMWAIGLTEKKPDWIAPLSLIGSRKYVAALLQQDEESLLNCFPYWDYQGQNCWYGSDLELSLESLRKHPEPAAMVEEGENLYFRYDRNRARIYSGHGYIFQARLDLKDFTSYLFGKFVISALKDQVVLASFPQYQRGHVCRVICLEKQFSHCFYGEGRKRNGFTEVRELKCSECGFYTSYALAEKASAIMGTIPSKITAR